MSELILHATGLNKHYGPIHALKDFDLIVKRGEIWGILGPNGSGKSTFLGIILSALHAQSGSYSWFGAPHSNLTRRRIGSLLEGPNFLPYLNALDNLKIIAKIKNVDHPDYEGLLRTVKLYERRKSAFKTYSLGMKQRLAIAATLIGDPDVLILDEPTNGLDPTGIAEIRSLLVELAGKGKTIIMASHILDEVEKICSHVAVLKRGSLLASGQVGRLLSPTKRVTMKSSHEALYDILSVSPQVNNVVQDEQVYTFEVEPDFPLDELCSYIASKGIVLTGIQEDTVSLEEEFLKITKA